MLKELIRLLEKAIAPEAKTNDSDKTPRDEKSIEGRVAVPEEEIFIQMTDDDSEPDATDDPSNSYRP